MAKGNVLKAFVIVYKIFYHKVHYQTLKGNKWEGAMKSFESALAGQMVSREHAATVVVGCVHLKVDEPCCVTYLTVNLGVGQAIISVYIIMSRTSATQLEFNTQLLRNQLE